MTLVIAPCSVFPNDSCTSNDSTKLLRLPWYDCPTSKGISCCLSVKRASPGVRLTPVRQVLITLPCWALSQYPKRRIFVRSRKVSKPRDLYLELSNRSEIWLAPRQHCCRCACQISKWYDNLKYQSRGFETSQDLTKRRLFGFWDRALAPRMHSTWHRGNHTKSFRSLSDLYICSDWAQWVFCNFMSEAEISMKPPISSLYHKMMIGRCHSSPISYLWETCPLNSNRCVSDLSAMGYDSCKCLQFEEWTCK